MCRSLIFGLVTSLSLPLAPARAQQPTPIQEGQAVSRRLGPGDRHVYGVKLTGDQFVMGDANQESIDVVVTLVAPDGTETPFDGPARGPETFTLVTHEPGEYQIVVTPFLDDETGTYTITLARIEPVATTPSGRVDQLFAPWTRGGSPGASVAIERNGEILYEQGYGLAQLEYDIPVTPTTIFHVASVSKQFTAFAIAMLAVEGRLSLDDDVRTYIPELPDFGHLITLRHLLHHTSGLRDQWNLLGLAGWRLDDVITKDQILRLFTREHDLNFVPGAEYLYCNTGYTLLAEVVARVSGQSFREWTAEHLFEPLGMTRTHFHDSHEEIVPNRAYSYAYAQDGGYRNSVLSYANAGATSLFTTAGDLARWMHNLQTGTVGGQRVLQLMHERGVLNNGDTIPYALGLGFGEYRGLTTVGHGGSDAGFRSNVVRFPDQGFSVAVLSNLAGFDPGGLARQVADIYLADEFEPAETTEAEDQTAESAEAVVLVDPRILEQYVGEYELVPGLRFTVTVRDGRLYGQATGQREFQLESRSDSVFTVPAVGAEMTFHRAAGDVELELVQGGQTIRSSREVPFDPSSVNLSLFTGVYDSPELETTYELVLDDGKLVARHVRNDPITLTPTAPGRFRGDAWFFQDVVFVRDPNGAVTQMRVSSGRVRNLLFTKREGAVGR